MTQSDVSYLENRMKNLGMFKTQQEKDKELTIVLLSKIELLDEGTLENGQLGMSCNILAKKLDYYNIPVKFKSNNGLAILELIANGNPGCIQVLMMYILKRLDKSKWSNLSCMDILMSLGENFPSQDDLLKLWDSQKDGEGFNNVDTLEYWREQLELR